MAWYECVRKKSIFKGFCLFYEGFKIVMLIGRPKSRQFFRLVLFYGISNVGSVANISIASCRQIFLLILHEHSWTSFGPLDSIGRLTSLLEKIHNFFSKSNFQYHEFDFDWLFLRQNLNYKSGNRQISNSRKQNQIFNLTKLN